MQVEVNKRLPHDEVPFFWIQPYVSPKANNLSEKLLITTFKRNFNPIDLNNVRKIKEIVPDIEVKLESSERSPWVMLSVFEKLNYQKATAYFGIAQFLATKLLIFVQASSTVFFIIGLSATILRLLQEVSRDGRLSWDILEGFGFWSGFFGIIYFLKLIVFQWSFGAIQDEWLLIILVFVSNIAYLALIKLLLPLQEQKNYLIMKQSMICLVYCTYTLTYAISYPWLTFTLY